MGTSFKEEGFDVTNFEEAQTAVYIMMRQMSS